MSWLRALEIVLRPFVAIVLFGSAAFGAYFIERYGMRRGWNGPVWRYLTHHHPVVPRTEADRRNWHGVVWIWALTLALFAVIWLAFPLTH